MYGIGISDNFDLWGPLAVPHNDNCFIYLLYILKLFFIYKTIKEPLRLRLESDSDFNEAFINCVHNDISGRSLQISHMCFCVCVCDMPVQSEDHVPEVAEEMVSQCAERLEQEACKELFMECTK